MNVSEHIFVSGRVSVWVALDEQEGVRLCLSVLLSVSTSMHLRVQGSASVHLPFCLWMLCTGLSVNTSECVRLCVDALECKMHVDAFANVSELCLCVYG